MSQDDPTPEIIEARGDATGVGSAATNRWQSGDSFIHRVTEVVSAATGTPVDRMRPLFEAIDPEAVTHLFESVARSPDGSASASVRFRYEGCRVEVDSDGRITAIRLE